MDHISEIQVDIDKGKKIKWRQEMKK
jgi:hypothetical protein